MKIKTRLLSFLTLVFAALSLFSCNHELIPSEDLFFQALEQSASGQYKEAAASFSACLQRRDEWAEVAADQLLELISDHPFLEVPRDTLKTAREYHPIQGSTLRSRTEYPLTFSAESLAGFSSQLLDDIGSAWVTGDVDKLKAANLFAEAASLKDAQTASQDWKAEKWLLSFYAGRLYEKNGSATYQKALTCYSAACSDAYTDLTYDRPLWYFLELSRRSSARNTAALLPEYSSTWHDSAYFDDFLERLASDLLSKYDWKTFVRVYSENEASFSNASRARYAVISARLIESGLCTAESAGFPDAAGSVSKLYETALANAEYGSYYDLIARCRTGRPFPEIESESTVVPDSEDTENSDSVFAEHLLGKLIEHDYADYAYRILKENTSDLSSNAIQNAYGYLLTKAGSEQKYLSLTSLALKTVRSRPDDASLMTLAYPPYYRTYIEDEARRFGLEPWLLFALIHSESCFQADITSTAGAHGLTQLMTATAGDIARKLKMSDYNLDDAPTNIKFGGYYLSELIGRLDGDALLAVFSYNAGITRVRNWKKQAPELPSDIFLETLPYEETRLYGQKITRAAVMYASLYYGLDYTDVIDFLLKI